MIMVFVLSVFSISDLFASDFLECLSNQIFHEIQKSDTVQGTLIKRFLKKGGGPSKIDLLGKGKIEVTPAEGKKRPFNKKFGLGNNINGPSLSYKLKRSRAMESGSEIKYIHRTKGVSDASILNIEENLILIVDQFGLTSRIKRSQILPREGDLIEVNGEIMKISFKDKGEIRLDNPKNNDVYSAKIDTEKFFSNGQQKLAFNRFIERYDYFNFIISVKKNRKHTVRVKVPKGIRSQKTVETIQDDLEKMPKEMIEEINSISYIPFPRNRKPGAVEHAWAGRGDIWFWDQIESNERLTTFRHELGHLIHFGLLTNKERNEFTQLFFSGQTAPVSQYGRKNPQEAFAEAIALYLETDGGRLSPELRSAFLPQFKFLDRIFDPQYIKNRRLYQFKCNDELPCAVKITLASLTVTGLIAYVITESMEP